jgi:hypothetical protein
MKGRRRIFHISFQIFHLALAIGVGFTVVRAVFSEEVKILHSSVFSVMIFTSNAVERVHAGKTHLSLVISNFSFVIAGRTTVIAVRACRFK